MSKHVHYFPLEHLDSRYTEHFDRVIHKHLLDTRGPHGFTRYYPDIGGRETQAPLEGQFLNASGTLEFKAAQLREFYEQVSRGCVADGDIVFFSDLWFPGVEGLAYLEFFRDVQLDIRGIIHAGSFTDTDFVREFERWAHQFENAVFDIADKVFVASEFLKRDLLKKRIIDDRKLAVTAFPLDPNLDKLTPLPHDQREPIVVFNGRLCDEKQPFLFDRLAERFPDGFEFVKTMERNLTKPEYYDLLSRASCVVSYALQENFGFGILEAVKLGCVPVLPNRLVYPEFFTDKFLFDTFEESVAMVQAALDGRLKPYDYATLPRGTCEAWFAE